MRHWLQLVTRSWRTKPSRAIASTAAIALGVGTVVSVTCFYESVRRAVTDQVVTNWLGKSHLSIEPPLAHWGRVDQSLAVPLAGLSNVQHVTYRLKRHLTVVLSAQEAALQTENVDAIGIDAGTEYVFREYREVRGRLIEPGERGVAVIETKSAQEWDVSIGDSIRMAVFAGGPSAPFTVVGTYETRRVAEFQRPTVLLPLSDLQVLKKETGQVTVIDLMLKDASAEGLRHTAEQVRGIVKQTGANYQVSTAEAKLQQLREAERVTQLILTLVAFVALLTSFFIILTTMSMGIVERIAVMGMMRCVGVTRLQLASLVLLEAVPLGIVGVVAGLPIGLGLTHLGAMLVPKYVPGVAISAWGMRLAIAGGAATTLAAAGLLVLQVCRVSPLEAANPEAKPPRTSLALVAAVAGAAVLAAHQWMIASVETAQWFEPIIAFCGVATIYVGYVLLAPALVLLAGTAVVHVVSAGLRVRRKLARDQIGRSPWRSAAVCWMLMVGLSLIVYIAVRTESIIGAWDFPSKLPATFVWSPDHVAYATIEQVKRVPGVADTTVVCDIACKAGDPKAEATSFIQGLKDRFKQPVPSTFVAGELETFLQMTKLGFLQGDLDSAVAKLKRGGYVLLPPESARTYGLGVGDRITITVGRRSAEFEVAGVVESPALDIAVTFFQADSYMMLAAAGSFLGTLDDARRHFGIDRVSMFMLDIDLPRSRRPAEFRAEAPPEFPRRRLAELLLAWKGRLPNERETLTRLAPALREFVEDDEAVLADDAAAELARFALALRDTEPRWEDVGSQERWDLFRERLVLRKVASVMQRPHAIMGSLRTLKESIDRDIREVTLLMSAIPAVALIVAMLGVANLMMVNVSARSRQIAVVRAVGATKSQIVRLVLAEALTLGALGSVVGVALGLHSAISMNALSARLIGIEPVFTVPWGHVVGGIGLTVLICLLASVAPARYAARNNIVDAIGSL
ncbi:MAG: FtsX-like permease family protein [Planctomycetota bacterium]|jgi:ABC-type antimicrobial peptide transport system permease subunit